MTNDELIAILVALPEADYRMVVDESEADRRRAFYAAVAAKRRPTLIAMWEADVAQYGEKPYCREYEDGLDGFVIHTRNCPRWPDGAVSGSGCINMTRVI